jgi:hypothetical protein
MGRIRLKIKKPKAKNKNATQATSLRVLPTHLGFMVKGGHQGRKSKGDFEGEDNSINQTNDTPQKEAFKLGMWHMSIIPALESKEYGTCEASLGYMV